LAPGGPALDVEAEPKEKVMLSATAPTAWSAGSIDDQVAARLLHQRIIVLAPYGSPPGRRRRPQPPRGRRSGLRLPVDAWHPPRLRCRGLPCFLTVTLPVMVFLLSPAWTTPPYIKRMTSLSSAEYRFVAGRYSL
jgi:hypothetical protein